MNEAELERVVELFTIKLEGIAGHDNPMLADHGSAVLTEGRSREQIKADRRARFSAALRQFAMAIEKASA